MRATLTLCVLLSTLCACSGGGGGSDETPTATPSPPAAAAVPQAHTIPVDVWVLTRDDGSGNDLWTEQYVRAVLNQATANVAGAVTLQLDQYHRLPDSEAYALVQLPLFHRYLDLPSPGAVTVVISKPDTTDSAGRTSTVYARAPYLVMRSRAQDWTGLDNTSQIFLHELGHQMHLRHEAVPEQGRPFHTDDYWFRADGREYLRQYARFLATQQ